MSRVREIIEKYFNSHHSEDTQRKFLYWFRNLSNNEEKDSVLENVWDELSIDADKSTERSYQTFQSRIEENADRHEIGRKSNLYKLSRVAAVLLISAISASAMFFVMKTRSVEPEELKLVECIVPDGEIRTVILPDSSIVKVNSGSILIYPQKFTGKRDVYLNGEAYFSVTRDEQAPFRVKTTDMDVEVLGTVFNVSSYADDDKSSATLESGKVNVKFHKTNRVVTLTRDEEVVYDRYSDLVEKHVVNVENTIAWINGDLIIQSMTIEEIAKVIERKYGMKTYLNTNKYKNEKITMKASHGESVETFMSILRYLVPQLRYRIEDDKVYIY